MFWFVCKIEDTIYNYQVSTECWIYTHHALIVNVVVGITTEFRYSYNKMLQFKIQKMWFVKWMKKEWQSVGSC